ncbi:hypothetical protein OG216_30460 [Streptomycetaceae bacterium NBC_01309]
MGQHGSGKGAHSGREGGSPSGSHGDANDGAHTGAHEAASAAADGGAATGSGAAGSAAQAPDENWDSWRLRLTDYGIGILIALILTPVLGFAVLMAVSGDFRDYLLK